MLRYPRTRSAASGAAPRTAATNCTATCCGTRRAVTNAPTTGDWGVVTLERPVGDPVDEMLRVGAPGLGPVLGDLGWRGLQTLQLGFTATLTSGPLDDVVLDRAVLPTALVVFGQRRGSSTAATPPPALINASTHPVAPLSVLITFVLPSSDLTGAVHATVRGHTTQSSLQASQLATFRTRPPTGTAHVDSFR